MVLFSDTTRWIFLVERRTRLVSIVGTREAYINMLPPESLFPVTGTMCSWLSLSCLVDPQGLADIFFFPREGRHVLSFAISLSA